MPVDLLPYNRTKYSDVMPDASKLGFCILYFEGINSVVRNAKKRFVSIPVRSLTNTTSFTVRLKLKEMSRITLKKSRLAMEAPLSSKWFASRSCHGRTRPCHLLVSHSTIPSFRRMTAAKYSADFANRKAKRYQQSLRFNVNDLRSIVA
ncbi:unnamed protein product [Cylicocyclus nassatus]|uniref:Uncharacterized protein n=1 Tax=Cylicocyclus nassatus TaxID=53992 RepID=A0AA36HCZ5_CYLNA|nr:unnamed protein product [Cylicocyclus nassatus]